MERSDLPDPEQTAAEFDRWADNGRDASMAAGHRFGTEAVLAPWRFGPGSVALDVGCGNGWAVHLMLERGASRGVGIDLSPGMVKRARTLAAGDPRLAFHVAAGDALPLADDGVSHVLSVESLYYYPDPGAALREWSRVAAPGAQLGIMIDLYRENPGSHPWIEALRPSGVRVHLLGASELAALAEAAGWAEPSWRQVVDPRPVRTEAEFQPDAYYPTYASYRQYRELGSLVFHATLPG